MSSILDYFEALERLKHHRPRIVAPGTKITNDSVALEAGRKKGAIKKGRSVFSALINAIEEASSEEQAKIKTDSDRVIKYKKKSERYRELYENAMARETMLVFQIYKLEEENAKMKKLN